MNSYIKLVPANELSMLLGELHAVTVNNPGLVAAIKPAISRAEAMNRFVEVPRDEVCGILTSQELIDDTLMQIILPATGTLTTFNYFEDIANAANLYTNLKQQSSLPWDEAFKVNGLGIWIHPPIIVGTSTVDAFTYFNAVMTGKWKFNVGHKDYNEGYLSSIVQSIADIEIFRNQATAAAAYDNVIAVNPPITKAKGYLPLPDGPTIDKTTPFFIQVDWAAAIGAANPVYVGLILYGKRVRPIR